MNKVIFNGAEKLIIVNEGITELDVQIDLYSAWKLWIQESDNSKFLPAKRTVGGDPTTGIKFVAPYFFLTNGWKIRPYEGDHTLLIEGNLFVDEPEIYGNNLTVPTLGDYTVTIVLSTTSDAIVASPIALTIEEHNKLMKVAESENLDLVKQDTEKIQLQLAPIPNILGLTQENFRVYDTQFDGNGKMIGAKIRIYPSKEDTNNDTNPINTYTVMVVYNANKKIISYKVTKDVS